MHVRGRGQLSALQTTSSSSANNSKFGQAKDKSHFSIIPMLEKFHDIIGGIHVPVDDGVDKLNRKYTLLVFLFLALPIFTKQYIGDPIECFAPVYFAEHQSRYINSYCWTQSTYYMVPVGDPEDDGDQQEPPDRIMPDEVDYFIGFETVTHIGNERLRRVRVSYYQWAPLILLVQGLCFYIPFLIWNSCANNAGVKLRRLLKKASDIASLPPGCQQREALLAEFVDQFHTLVTGEAGWCADLQCHPGNSGGGGAGGGSAPNSNASSLSSGSSAQSGPPPVMRGPGQQQNRSQNQQQDDHHHRGANANNANHRDHHNSNSNRDNNQESNQGCCLVSIPIIGSLLACCLKPCASFALVGPSKYLCLLYLAVKFAYVFNVGLQFYLLSTFLGRGYLKHGLELINRLIVNGDWWNSPRFPLSTLCQVRADMSGGLRSYTCQCVLPINVFNEKIFSVVWFYMAFLMPLNVLSLLFWIYRTFESNRLSYIRLCLWRTRLVELNQIHRTVRKLSQSYLGWDGVFLLRLIEHNHGSIMATLIMSRLWEFYANQMKLQEDANMIAMANNAQHTLSQTTTAISNQHQILAAAAAAAAAAAVSNNPHNPQQQQQPHPPPHHGANSHHSHHQHQHAVSGNQFNQNNSSSAVGPPPPAPPHPHHHSSSSGGGSHHHGPHPPLMPSVVGGNQFHTHLPNGHSHHPHGNPQQQMMQQQGHGAHAHHSGQISSQPGHHPLHAANTAAHHGHAHAHAASHQLVAAAAAAAAAGAAGPFVGPNASLLAQLQQQHHAHAPPNQTHVQASGANATTSIGSQAANQGAGGNQTTSQQQASASGNVAAAVAALAAAAAANSTTNNQALASSTASGTTTSTTATTTTSSATGNVAGTATVAGSKSATSNAIHLHSLLQQAAVAAACQQQQTSSPSANATANATAQAAASSSNQQAPATATSSATTSFITGAPPQLPPPPPAHVVAAVAAAASSANIPSGQIARPGPPASAAALLARVAAQQHHQQQQQPPPPQHSNQLLFNLKSSSASQQSAASGAASATPAGGAQDGSGSQSSGQAPAGSAASSGSSQNRPISAEAFHDNRSTKLYLATGALLALSFRV